MTCSKCKTINESGAVYCANCGNFILEGKKLCYECKETVELDKKYCPNCKTYLRKGYSICVSCKKENSTEYKYCPKCKKRNINHSVLGLIVLLGVMGVYTLMQLLGYLGLYIKQDLILHASEYVRNGPNLYYEAMFNLNISSVQGYELMFLVYVINIVFVITIISYLSYLLRITLKSDMKKFPKIHLRYLLIIFALFWLSTTFVFLTDNSFTYNFLNDFAIFWPDYIVYFNEKTYYLSVTEVDYMFLSVKILSSVLVILLLIGYPTYRYLKRVISI